MVRQHHQVIRTRRELDGPLQARELGVVLPEHREGVGSLDARVVRNLVVPHEGRIDDRDALDDVAQQRRHVEVAHDDRDRGPDQGVEAAALNVLLSALPLAAGGPQLEEHVPKGECDRAREPVRIGEVGEVLPRAGSARGRAARSSSPSSAVRPRRTCSPGSRRRRRAGRRRPSDAARARRRPCRDWTPSSARSPSRTSGRRACRRCCPGEGRPGSRRSARRGRTPREDPVGALLEPPRHRRRVPLARAPSSRRARRRPSISNMITPGTSVRSPLRTLRARLRTRRSCRASSSMPRAGARTRRHTERTNARSDGTEEARRRSVNEVDRERDQSRVQNQRTEAEGEDSQRQEQPNQQRP